MKLTHFLALKGCVFAFDQSDMRYAGSKFSHIHIPYCNEVLGVYL